MDSPRAVLGLALILMMLSPSVITSEPSSAQSIIMVPGDYFSIQAAIANADAGSTILVSPGKYVEHLRVDKPLTIIGSGNSTVIENDGASATIEILRGVNGVAIANFYVNSSGASTGIYIAGEDCNVQNITVANHEIGIFIWDSSENFLRNNRMVGNKYNLEVWGLALSHFMHDIDDSNLVDGRKVYYWVNEHDRIVPSDAGYVAVVNSTNITIKDLNLTRNYSGILLAYTSNSLVLNATCSRNTEGILFFLSNNNTIVESSFESNEWTGISFCASSSNCVVGNTARLNRFGIYLYYSSLIPERSEDNSIYGNVFSEDYYGAYLEVSSRNRVCNDDFANNTIGACVDHSSQVVFSNDSFSRNTECGVKIDGSEGNDFYHNGYLNNTVQISHVKYINLPVRVNMWDNGFPSGGNYWSDYYGNDTFSGPYQNQTGSDGIGDSPYVINPENSDLYPLIAPPEKNTQLTVDFSYSPQEPKLFEAVNFTDETASSSGIALSLWVFSDNQLFRSQNVSRMFERSQNYSVALYVVDHEGVTSFTQRNFQVRKIFSTTTLSVEPELALLEEVAVTARLADENSEALTDATINFYVVTGVSEELIGASQTNSTGHATIFHSFNQTGPLTIEAEYQGDQWHAPSDSKMSVRIVSAGSPIPILIAAAASSFAVASLLLLYAWRRRRKLQSITNEESVASR